MVAPAEWQSLLVRAAGSAVATGVAFALWWALGDRDFDLGAILLAPALASAALSMPGRSDRSYVVNAVRPMARSIPTI